MESVEFLDSWASLNTGCFTAGINKAHVNSHTGGDYISKHSKSFHHLCLSGKRLCVTVSLLLKFQEEMRNSENFSLGVLFAVQ